MPATITINFVRNNDAQPGPCRQGVEVGVMAWAHRGSAAWPGLARGEDHRVGAQLLCWLSGTCPSGVLVQRDHVCHQTPSAIFVT